ncbi:SDR family NAD(P)-dependent oxidoreductase [Novosphingobium sp.]|uniref:SDR family NAD(P)-dependent oxidoreductase n=1 Tax=Novosphingobium sp. TaxID=1874826 RepID=UPI002622195E|nr:SDR family NAD(P)-dependent oxidoreductase [Novosphingobium sp.]
MTDLAGHHAVITGGGTGIGAAIARTLHGAGARVTLMGRRLEPLEQVAALLPGSTAICVDVTDEASVEDAMAEARAVAPVSILVNNAGGAETAPLAKTSMALWQQMIAVNLTGAFLCTRAVLKEVAQARNGRIIMIASTSGLKGYAYTGAYAAAKHGVIGLTRTLALELASTGATANAICPGFADTELVQRSIAAVTGKTGRLAEDVLAQFVRDNPQKRLIRPEEVAATALWLCDPLSGSVNGQSIAVAGGEVM